jgi:hypothetical protein
MMRDNSSHIHCWDRALFLRALAWAVAIEAVMLVLFWLGFEEGGGPPHNPPRNPFMIVSLLFHLPAIMIAVFLGLNILFAVVLQSALVTYVLFVWFRLKKIKITLR